MNVRGYNIKNYLLWKLFKKYPPLSDDFFDFDEIIRISDNIKSELIKK